MANQEANSKCCEVKTACGRSLRHGVVFVGTSTLVISSVAFLVSVVTVFKMAWSKVLLNSQPVEAVNLIFGLVTIFISVYQIVISTLLLWQALKTKGNIFLCSVWFVSHLSILTLFFILFCARATVCFLQKWYYTGVVTLVMGLIYEGIFIYFAIVVNSYLLTLDHDRFF